MGTAQLPSFGELLRRYRLEAGLTQAMLAERAKMSLATIGKLERGARQKPYRATIALLSEAFSLREEDRQELERAAHLLAGVGSESESIGATIRLPVHFSSFVGRERDLANVVRLLDRHRLVTIVGAGGVGKTRLALRAAENLLTSNPVGEPVDGVWFADLSSLTDGAMLAMALGSSIGIGQCRNLDVLARHLRSQTFLLILDNCEHLLDPIAYTAEALLAGCPNGRIMATSRQALSVEGERVYRLPTLDIGDAIELFKDRAEATDSRFELTGALLPAVTDICKGVDGIALAIELAAARINAFSPENIADQIGQRLSLLAGGTRTSLPRHKTMHALFDWSYDNLNGRESELFRRSSIFANGFTLDLLCGLYVEEERIAVPSLLASLVDKSLVQCDILVGPRYRLLEPARQYAREKLSGEEYERAARLQVLALLALAEDFDARLEVIPDRIWSDRIEREQENFRAAVEWAFGTNGDVVLGQRLVASRSATWSASATGELRAWIATALERNGESTPPHVRAKLALNAARATVIFGPFWRPENDPENDPEAGIEAGRRALALARHDDRRAVASAQFWLGVALRDFGRFDEAQAILREARATARSVGAQMEYNAATTALGAAHYGAGDVEEAHALLSEALQASEEAGSDRIAADARIALAEMEFARGHAEEALALSDKTTQFFRATGNRLGLQLTLANSAGYLIALKRFAQARNCAADALLRARAIGMTHGGLWAMQHLVAAMVLDDGMKENRPALSRAACILGFIDDAAALRGMPRYSSEQRQYERLLAVLGTSLGKSEVRRLMAIGKTCPEDRAVTEALDLEPG